MPITGVLGGPLSGWIMQSMDGVGGWPGWRWLFVVEGLPTVAIGVMLYLLLHDRPAQAPWLTPHEKARVAALMDSNRAGGSHGTDGTESAGGAAEHGRIRVALTDPRTYVLAFVYFCCACAVYTFTFWLPTLIKAQGISSLTHIGWYSAVPYLFGAIGVLLISRSSDRLHERRWHVGGTLALGAATLYATSWAGTSLPLVMVLLCVAAFLIFGGGSLFWSIPPTYLSRETSAAGIAVISSLGILGGFVSPAFIGWIKETTGNIQTGLLALTVLTIIGGVITLTALPASAVRVGSQPAPRR